MFTVEHHFDSTEIVSIDERDEYSDVEVLLCDEDIFIVQHHLDIDVKEIIYMSYQQLTDIVAAINLPEGAYLDRRRRK